MRRARAVRERRNPRLFNIERKWRRKSSIHIIRRHPRHALRSRPRAAPWPLDRRDGEVRRVVRDRGGGGRDVAVPARGVCAPARHPACRRGGERRRARVRRRRRREVRIAGLWRASHRVPARGRRRRRGCLRASRRALARCAGGVEARVRRARAERRHEGFVIETVRGLERLFVRDWVLADARIRVSRLRGRRGVRAAHARAPRSRARGGGGAGRGHPAGHAPRDRAAAGPRASRPQVRGRSGRLFRENRRDARAGVERRRRDRKERELDRAAFAAA